MIKIYIFLLLIISVESFSQIEEGYYIGYERIEWINEKGKKKNYNDHGKWYHLNHLLIKNDSIYLYKIPFSIKGKDTTYSASDGGFYYYSGNIFLKDSIQFVALVMTNCDYCNSPYRLDSLTGFYYPRLDTLKYNLFLKNSEININNVYYKKSHDSFPIQNSHINSIFRFNESSIFRFNPTEQYNLINQTFEFFFAHTSNVYANPIIICVDRFNENNGLIETLDSDSLIRSVKKYKICYMRYNDILEKMKKDSFSYITIDEIIDNKGGGAIITINIRDKVVSHDRWEDMKNRIVFECIKKDNRYIFLDEAGFEIK